MMGKFMLSLLVMLPCLEVVSAAQYTGRYKWGKDGGTKKDPGGALTCKMTAAADGSWTLSFVATFKGKAHPHTGTLQADPEQADSLIGEATDKKGKVTYYVRASIHADKEYRGIAYRSKDEQGVFGKQIATFTMRPKTKKN